MSPMAAYVVVVITVCMAGLVLRGEATESFVHAQERGTAGWDRVVIPREGIYLVSATLDPIGVDTAWEHLVVKKNNQTMLIVYAYKSDSSAAIASQLLHNDVITATPGPLPHNIRHSGRHNRLVVVLVSWAAVHDARMTTDADRRYESSEPVQFGKKWHSLGGWLPEVGRYVEPITTGVYWIMARAIPARGNRLNNLVVRIAKGLDRLSRPAFILWTLTNRPAACAGAFYLTNTDIVFMKPFRTTYYVDPGTILSIVQLSENYQLAFTAWAIQPSGTSCANDGFKRDTRRIAHMALDSELQQYDREYQQYAMDKQGAGRYHNLHNHTAHSRHARRSVPGDTRRSVPRDATRSNDFQLEWVYIATNLGNMSSHTVRDVTIPRAGAYLVGMRPEGNFPADARMSFVLLVNGQIAWRTYGEGASSGETFAMLFQPNDKLEFHAQNGCRVQWGSIVSVAFLNGPSLHH